MDPQKKQPINFYDKNQKFGEFSNLYKSPTTIQGVTYATNEHYFQSKKFHPLPYQLQVAKAKTAFDAFKMGQSREHPCRKDWEEVKQEVMYEGLKHKFTQNEHCKNILLSTGDCELIEHTTKDSYWGDGGDGSGKNRLGFLLMKLRQELKVKI